MEFIKKEYKTILLMSLLFFVSAFLFKYKMTDLYIDFGRETIIPRSILEGKVLYRDIFSIYFPFSYLLNAVFLKLLGVNLKTFNIIGFLNTYVIFISLYFIARKFLDRVYSVLLCFFMLFVCAVVPAVTNYITPYSYAAVYGISAVCLCILCSFSYLKTCRTIFLYISFLSAGIALANKFDYVFCIIPLIWAVLYKKTTIKTKAKTICICCALYFMPIAVSFAILAYQGLTIYDLNNYFQIINRYIHSPLLYEFYRGTMTFSLKEFIGEIILMFISAGIFVSVFKILKFFDNKNIKNTELPIFAALFFMFYKLEIFSTTLFFHYFPLLLFLLFIFKIKEIKNNPQLLFLILMTFSFGIKSLFLLNTSQYGRYFLPFYMLCIVIVLVQYYFLKDSDINKRAVVLVLCALITANLCINIETFKYYSHKIQTPHGTVYATEKDKKIFDYIINYVKQNTDKNDKIVVLRESSIINFLTDRKTDDFYNHFENISFYAFGEDKIISHYNKNKPDYFIIFTSLSDNNAFCNGYGANTCRWIEKNYNLKQIIKSEPLILIFEKI